MNVELSQDDVQNIINAYDKDIKKMEQQEKEIDRLNNLNKQLVEECQKLDDEETRLKIIINELEKFLENEINLNNLDSYTLQKTREYLNFKCYELKEE